MLHLHPPEQKQSPPVLQQSSLPTQENFQSCAQEIKSTSNKCACVVLPVADSMNIDEFGSNLTVCTFQFVLLNKVSRLVSFFYKLT